jgi:glycyl-tRNA synthetase
MEIEYFIDPETTWEPLFDEWLEKQKEFFIDLGAKEENLRAYEHPKEKLSHYSKKTIDWEYNFSFGWGEVSGLAHRGNFDLTQHTEFGNEKLDYFDPKTSKRFTPHVLEPTFGLDRAILTALVAAYNEEGEGDNIRTVLKFPYKIAPIKMAVFPLLKNKPELVKKAKEVFANLSKNYMCEFDDNGNIGKRYRRQDEIGTPFCVTIDFDTLEKDESVTVRDRDTMEQERIKISELESYFQEKF